MITAPITWSSKPDPDVGDTVFSRPSILVLPVLTLLAASLAQTTRMLPNLATVLGWESCDHTGPVHEGDTLHSELHVEAADPLPNGESMITITAQNSRGGVKTEQKKIVIQ